MADELAEMRAATAAVHVPGPTRMVGRRPAPRACLGCGDPWPCEHSWQARAERAEVRLERAEAALAGGNEGIRLWMLDCGELVAKHRARAEHAEARLAEILQAIRTFTDVRVCGTDTLDLAEAVRQIAERKPAP